MNKEIKNRTVFMTGGSRGIGRAIALRLAKEGMNITIAAKSIKEDSRLGGTIFSVAKEIESAGGKALPVQCDIRFEDQVKNAVDKAVSAFGGIDILINNASAIDLSPTELLTIKHFDLMHDINIRGTFLAGKYSLPYLKKSDNAHILSLSPPLNLNKKWFGKHGAYTLSKYGMTILTLGWAEEYKDFTIAANTLWPRTTIDTAAVRNLLGGRTLADMSRKPEIIAEAAWLILSRNKAVYNGRSFIDEDLLRENGFTDFEQYAVTPGGKLFIDLFIDE